MNKILGKQSIRFENPPIISGAAAVVGAKEGEGPYGKYFDCVVEDAMAGATSWEAAEGEFQKKAAGLAIDNSGYKKDEIRYIIAGDLLGQLMASSFGLMQLELPMFGLYGACSTMGEALSVAAMTIDGGYADHVLALTSSHFASAEKQFRFPLGYANQRPRAATWTVTGSGGVVVSRALQDENRDKQGYTPSKEVLAQRGKVRIMGITTGKIIDYGVKDSMNMGACMAPAAGDLIARHFSDFGSMPDEYDRIITGDLGLVGKDILLDIMRAKGYDIEKQYMDCGIEIYDEEQNVQAGGSGCGCSATMFAGYILKMLSSGEWKKVLFVPTGALMSPVSFNEGNSVPGIAHGVMLERDLEIS